MAALSEQHKRLIVQRLATFHSPSQIADELQDMGVVASLSQIVYYDPESKTSDLAQKWRDLHRETRAAFVKDTASIAVAHKSFRLRELGRMYRNAMSAARPNMVLAKELLEQCAKEVGEAYTNRRVISSADPLTELAKILGFTPEALATLIAMDDGDGTGPGMEVTH